MVKKNYLVLGLLGLTSCAFTGVYANPRPVTGVYVSPRPAAGVYVNPRPAAFAPYEHYMYVGGQLGWAHSAWSDFTNLQVDNEGFAYGAKIGYQATRRFGAEIGGFGLPRFDINNALTSSGSVKSWVGYGVATFRLPLLRNERLYLRGKVGPAYRSLRYTGPYSYLGTGHYWTAILGASINYAFGNGVVHPVILGFEYSNIFGSSGSWSENGNIDKDTAPSAQIYAATLSFAFRV